MENNSLFRMSFGWGKKPTVKTYKYTQSLAFQVKQCLLLQTQASLSHIILHFLSFYVLSTKYSHYPCTYSPSPSGLGPA